MAALSPAALVATRADIARVETTIDVVNRTTLAQPVSPTEGQAWLIPASGTVTGAQWAAAPLSLANNDVVRWTRGAWEKITRRAGLMVFVLDEIVRLEWTGTAWRRTSDLVADGGLIADAARPTVQPFLRYQLRARSFDGLVGLADNEWVEFEAPSTGSASLLDGVDVSGTAGCQPFDLDGDATLTVASTSRAILRVTRESGALRISSGGASSQTGVVFPVATANGTTDDRAALAAADTTAAGAKAVYLKAGVYRVASNLTIASTVTFEAGAVLKPDSGVTVTLSRPVSAGLEQIFDTSAGGVVALAARQGEAHAMWWGAKFDNVTDDAPALRAASAACNAVNARLIGLGGHPFSPRAKINSSVAFARRAKDFRVNMAAITATTALNARLGAGTGRISSVVGLHVDADNIFHASYPKTTLAAARSRGDVTATFAAGGAAAIAAAVGDRLLIHQDAAFGATASAKKSESVLVRSLSGEVAGFTARLLSNYTTAATVRAYNRIDVEWDDVLVEGANNDTLNQVGAAIMQCRSVHLNNVVVNDCDFVGLLLTENGLLQFDTIGGRNAEDNGLGYAVNTGGTDIVVGQAVTGDNGKHCYTGGGGWGPEYPLTRTTNITMITGIGVLDALFDTHDGTDNVIVGQVTGSMRIDPAGTPTSGDAVVCASPRAQFGVINVSGFRRAAFVWEFYGDDGLVWSALNVRSLIGKSVQGASPVQPGLSLNNYSSTTAGDIDIDHCDLECQGGVYVNPGAGGMGVVRLKGGKVWVAGAGTSGVAGLSTEYSGATGQLKGLEANLSIDAPLPVNLTIGAGGLGYAILRGRWRGTEAGQPLSRIQTVNGGALGAITYLDGDTSGPVGHLILALPAGGGNTAGGAIGPITFRGGRHVATAGGAIDIKAQAGAAIGDLTIDGARITGTFAVDFRASSTGPIGDTIVTGSKLFSTANSVDTVLIAGTGAPAGKLRATASHFDAPVGGRYPIYLAGASGVNIVGRSSLFGCSTKGGTHGIRADQCTVDYAAHEFSTHSSANTLAGTGGVFNAIT